MPVPGKWEAEIERPEADAEGGAWGWTTWPPGRARQSRRQEPDVSHGQAPCKQRRDGQAVVTAQTHARVPWEFMPAKARPGFLSPSRRSGTRTKAKAVNAAEIRTSGVRLWSNRCAVEKRPDIVGERRCQIDDRHQHRKGKALGARRAIIGSKRQGRDHRQHPGKAGAKINENGRDFVGQKHEGQRSSPCQTRCSG